MSKRGEVTRLSEVKLENGVQVVLYFSRSWGVRLWISGADRPANFVGKRPVEIVLQVCDIEERFSNESKAQKRKTGQTNKKKRT